VEKAMTEAARRRTITAADVQLAADSGARDLVVGADVIVTPLARDVARERGLTLRTSAADQHPADDRDDLVASVRRIVAGMVGNGASAGGAPSRIRHVESREVSFEPFPFEGPEENMVVQVADVVTTEHGATIGAGFLTLTRGCFPWTLTYDEVEYVIEGELHLGTDDGVVVGRPGDVLYVPKGSRITFGTPSWARLLYVTYPADWAEGVT
jgi:ethanolamine utilization protein EutQ